MAGGVVLLVTGSRSIEDPWIVDYVLQQVVPAERATCIMHGGAAGVDTLADAWARQQGLPVVVVPGQRGAYLARDKAMVERADRVVAIWDGHSRGTQYTADTAAGYGKLASLWRAQDVREELYGGDGPGATATPS